MTRVSRVIHLLRNFTRAKEGNVAITFALAVLPVVGFVGAAVDYSRANSARTALQAALDSTALMLSKEAAKLSSAQLQQKANDYFLATFHRPEAKSIKITPTYTTGKGSTIIVKGTAAVPANFVSMLGYEYLTIGGESTVKWGNKRLRVALALDVTGSMSSAGKMPAMKTAAKNLLEQLKKAATQNGDVYVSIIPFNKDVNVKELGGNKYYNATWVDFSDHGSWDGWDNENGECDKKKGKYKTKESCEDAGYDWEPDKHSEWNGCVADRDQDYDTTNTVPSPSVKATLFPAEQFDDCPAPLMGLSYDWTALNAKIDSLSPVGNTNQTIGLQWGFQSLTASPFTIPAKDQNYEYQETVILLTDGLNTQNRFSSNQTSIDARTKKACDNIKAAGMTIYSIQVNTGGDPTSTMLQQCASSSDKFFMLTSANQIVSTFEQIGTALSQLRIAE